MDLTEAKARKEACVWGLPSLWTLSPSGEEASAGRLDENRQNRDKLFQLTPAKGQPANDQLWCEATVGHPAQPRWPNPETTELSAVFCHCLGVVCYTVKSN